MKAIPQVRKFMTPMPHTIGSDIPLKTAMTMMQENHFRHLPVQEGGKLVGIISDRDVKLATGFGSESEFTVEDVMSPDPFTCDPDAPLDEVVIQMAERKFGCAIVTQSNGKVVGIFTATDGLRVLGEILQANFKKTSI